MEKKKIDFCIGSFDNLSEEILEKINNDINNSEIYVVGVYTDRVLIQNFFTQPINNFEKRMETIKNIPGVKFAIELDTSDPDEIKEIIKKETVKFLS